MLELKLNDLLENHPIHLGDNFAIEIIPFGALLNMILEKLKQKVAWQKVSIKVQIAKFFQQKKAI